MRETLTTILDLLGLLLIAAGLTYGMWLQIGPWALILGGVAVLIGSWLAARGDGP